MRLSLVFIVFFFAGCSSYQKITETSIYYHPSSTKEFCSNQEIPSINLCKAKVETETSSVPKIDRWENAQQNFIRWQKQIIEKRLKPTQEFTNILHHQVEIPIPDCTKGSNDYLVKMYFPILFDPKITPGLIPKIGVGMGSPHVQLSFNAEARVFRFTAFRHKIGLAYAAKNNSIAFMNITGAKAIFPFPGSSQTEIDVGGEYQIFAHQLKENSDVNVDAGITMNLGAYSAGVGVTPNGEFAIKGGIGISGVPKIAKKVVELKGNVELQASAPLAMTDIQYGSQYGLAQLSSSAAELIRNMVSSPISCSYCSGRGEIRCRQCNDLRTITCPKCNGSLKEICGRCNSSGHVSCPTTESCGNCSGTGRLRCGNCSYGKVTEYRTVTKTRWISVPYQAGFDSSGQPYYNKRWESQQYTDQEAVSVDCPACGGSGRVGSCGSCGGDGQVVCSRCSGQGWLTCSSCNGSGKVPCSRCDGKGKVTCPTCWGNAIICGLCQGKKKLGAHLTQQPVLAYGLRTKKVSAYTAKVLKDILKTAGESSAQITSTERTSYDQARIMYNNIEKKGVKQQQNLYGRYGDMVIDVYIALHKTEKDKKQIIRAMQAKIEELGTTNVSKHCSNPKILGVVDIAPTSIKNREKFVQTVQRAIEEGKISKFLFPPKDRAYHLEIPQK